MVRRSNKASAATGAARSKTIGSLDAVTAAVPSSKRASAAVAVACDTEPSSVSSLSTLLVEPPAGLALCASIAYRGLSDRHLASPHVTWAESSICENRSRPRLSQKAMTRSVVAYLLL
jgi:hypothetical protein